MWIEYHVELLDHYKVARLARELGVEYAAALGHLSCIWLFAAAEAKNGDFRKISDEELAHKAHWAKAPAALIKGMVAAGWIEPSRRLHDWQDYGLRVLNDAKARAAKYRATKRDDKPLTVQPRHVTTEGRKERKNERIHEQTTRPALVGMGFDTFWSSYPRKEGKVTAQRAFERIGPGDEMLAVMLKAVAQQKRSRQWTKDDGQFIPHAATWLNQRRWEDVGVVSPAREDAERSVQQTQETIANIKRLKAETAHIGGGG